MGKTSENDTSQLDSRQSGERYKVARYNASISHAVYRLYKPCYRAVLGTVGCFSNIWDILMPKDYSLFI